MLSAVVVVVVVCATALSSVPAAAVAAADPASCSVQQGYTISNLTRAAYWTYAAGADDCVGLTAQPASPCVYRFSLCSALNYPDMPGACSSSSICVEPESAGVPAIKLADYEPQHNPFSLTSLNVNEFVAHYSGGAAFNGTLCITTTVRFVFRCNPNVPWIPNEPPAESTVPEPVSILYNIQDCKVTFTFQYPGACYTFTPGDLVTALSAGSILLILFFVGIFVYCAAGLAFKYTTGNTGMQMVPNLDFWTAAKDDVVRGCRYTAHIVTCSGNGTSGTAETKPGSGTYDPI